MKILFYDVRNFELEYLLERIPANIEPCFIKCPLNGSTYVDEKNLDCEALSVFVSSWLDEEVLSKFKNLKYIFLRSVGFSHVDLKYCKNNNISVFNAPNYGNSTVAEYVFALLLTLSKNVIRARESIFSGEIDQDDLMGIELFSKTMGVIGAGAIGRKVINIADAFGMKVLVYDPERKGAYNFVELDELFEKSDVISINCPLNESTKGMINSETLSKMKKEAFLINTARGEIVNTKDLYLALVDKKIKGAALDVIECEEILCASFPKCLSHDSLRKNCLKKFFFIQKLLQLPQVIVTPHIAYDTKEAQKKILDITLSNINSSFDINSGVKNLVLI